jgi:hypothetical protein
MLAKVETYQERMEAKIDTSNEKFEVLRGTLVSRMDIYQPRTESAQEMKVKMDIHQEKMQTTIHSIQSELQETIKHRMEDMFVVRRPKDAGPPKGRETFDGTQMGLPNIRTSIGARTGSRG